MSVINPFKPGDKLVCLESLHPEVEVVGNIYTVVESWTESCGCYVRLAQHVEAMPKHRFDVRRYRAAIKGKDYVDALAPKPNALYPSGHLSDGSSVQKHSAGGLYPVVLVYRDKKVPHRIDGKYDVGVLTPDGHTTWMNGLDNAVALAELWLKGKA